jgi:hypothetical protein
VVDLPAYDQENRIFARQFSYKIKASSLNRW